MPVEIGYQTDAGHLQGWVQLAVQAHETNPDLRWPRSIDVFDRMRSEDAQVSSVMRAVQLPIISAKWEIDPNGADPEIVAHVADDLGLPIKGEAPVAALRSGDRFSWSDHIRLALLELDFGHSYFEQVFRIDERGLAHIRKLAWRPPRSISDIDVARDGGLVAIEQHGAFGSKPVRIPVDRLVAYINQREGGNWLGRSLLRAAYKHWIIKDRLMRIQVLTAERNGLGIPVHTSGETPDSVEDPKTFQQEQVDRGLDIATQARAGETAGVSLPHGAKLEFLGVTGKLPDTDKPIRYHDEQMTSVVLAHFLNLGGENSTGSYALGATFANFFTDSLNAVAQHIADVTQQHVIEDLVDKNWGPTARAPRIVPAKIGAEHPATADAIKALIEVGALTRDPALEAHLRALYGLPALAAELAAKGVPVGAAQSAADDIDARREAAKFISEVAQKIYLATDKPPLRQDEARAIIAEAGGELSGNGPDVSRIADPNAGEES